MAIALAIKRGRSTPNATYSMATDQEPDDDHKLQAVVVMHRITGSLMLAPLFRDRKWSWSSLFLGGRR